MANPRKFSEKIALHRQRQAEEQASYERVLMEVRAVTQTPMQSPCGGPRMPGPSPMLGPSHMLDRSHQHSMRNMWSSMPNIHSAAQQQQQQHQQQPSTGFYQNNNQQMGLRNTNFQLSSHQNQQAENMFFEPNDHGSMNNHAVQSGQPGPMAHQNPIFLEPPNWPMSGPGQGGMTNQGYANGSLPRCFSENSLHQSAPNTKLKSNMDSNFHTNGQVLHTSPEPTMRERLIRLRPPEGAPLTPQGAPCGSLPDLNKLVIPKNSRPSSAKSGQTTTKDQSYECKRRVDSPRVMRERAPSNPSSNVGSPRANPRRPHPYGGTNRLSWNLTGSSPSSPVSANIAQRGLNSNSLPSSPQTPRTQDALDNGFLKENIAECLNSPSPVPEIVLTPSEYSTNCSMGMSDHPLQLSGFNTSSQNFFGSSVSSSSSSVNQSNSNPNDNHLMEFTSGSDSIIRSTMTHQHSNNPSMPSNFTFLNEINSIQTPQNQHQTHPSHDIPALITPNPQQLEQLLENGKLSFDSL